MLRKARGFPFHKVSLQDGGSIGRMVAHILGGDMEKVWGHSEINVSIVK